MAGILKEIVRENQGRGVSDEELRSHQDELLGAAQQSARDRVRTNFLLLRIAEKEKIEVGEQDIAQRVYEMAARYEIPVKKLIKDFSAARASVRCVSRSWQARLLICSPSECYGDATRCNSRGSG